MEELEKAYNKETRLILLALSLVLVLTIILINSFIPLI